MLLIVMVKLSPVNITNEIKGTQREITTVETDTVLSASQTLRSDQPIHGGDCMLLIVMVKLSSVNITNEIKGTQREITTVETDTVLSASQTLRSDQPIQTFEMETLL